MLLRGKKGLIAGIANEHSIAYGCRNPTIFIAPRKALAWTPETRFWRRP